jgi:hypothetical protein
MKVNDVLNTSNSQEQLDAKAQAFSSRKWEIVDTTTTPGGATLSWLQAGDRHALAYTFKGQQPDISRFTPFPGKKSRTKWQKDTLADMEAWAKAEKLVFDIFGTANPPGKSRF